MTLSGFFRSPNFYHFRGDPGTVGLASVDQPDEGLLRRNFTV
jgi:hypothetical protein